MTRPNHEEERQKKKHSEIYGHFRHCLSNTCITALPNSMSSCFFGCPNRGKLLNSPVVIDYQPIKSLLNVRRRRANNGRKTRAWLDAPRVERNRFLFFFTLGEFRNQLDRRRASHVKRKLVHN